jgi:hypothetical protein
MTQSMANPMLENGDAVPTTQPVAESKILNVQNTVSGLKHAGYCMAAVSCLGLLKKMINYEYNKATQDEHPGTLQNKVLFPLGLWTLGAVIGVICARVESKQQPQKQLSQQNILQNRMISAPLWGVSASLILVTLAKNVTLEKNKGSPFQYLATIATGLSFVSYFAGATWLLKDWYQGHHSSQNADNKSKIFWNELC